MQYQISYYSPNGRAETLVNAFCQMLPNDSYISNLEEEDVPYADIQLVGFDMGGTNLDAIPFKVIEYLEKLDGKAIFLFATVPFIPNEAVEGRIHNNVLPFLPDECDFRGLYLCGAEPSNALLQDLRRLVAQQPENTRAKHWLERCERAVEHPDRNDVLKGCQFMKHVLDLN